MKRLKEKLGKKDKEVKVASDYLAHIDVFEISLIVIHGVMWFVDCLNLLAWYWRPSGLIAEACFLPLVYSPGTPIFYNSSAD